MKFIQRLLLNIASKFTRIVGEIHAPFARKKMMAKDYRSLHAKWKSGLVLPGDVIVTFTRGELGNIFIPGDWSHAGIIDAEFNVIEAVGKGVVETDMIDFLMKKDFAIVLRPLFLHPSEMLKAVGIARDQIGKPYDFDIEASDISAFYCSELVYFAYAKAGKQIPFTPREILGRQTISPSDFVDAKSKFQVVWDSKVD